MDSVVLFGAPLFRDEAEARRQLKKMGALESFFARDSPLAPKSCALMCAHRRLAGLLAVALSPDLPIAISSRAVLHTWPAYRGALGLFFSDWQEAMRKVEQTDLPVTLIAGEKDQSQVEGLADFLAAKYSHITAIHVRDAAHILPITHGTFCAETILREAAASSS